MRHAIVLCKENMHIVLPIVADCNSRDEVARRPYWANSTVEPAIPPGFRTIEVVGEALARYRVTIGLRALCHAFSSGQSRWCPESGAVAATRMAIFLESALWNWD
jgi:hypothetical protein